MQREGAGDFSYLPAEGGEGVQALFVLGGVALLGVVPAAALREQRQGESQWVPVLAQLPVAIPPGASGVWTPSTGPETPGSPELLIWKKRPPKEGAAQPRADPQGRQHLSPSKRKNTTEAI